MPYKFNLEYFNWCLATEAEIPFWNKFNAPICIIQLHAETAVRTTEKQGCEAHTTDTGFHAHTQRSNIMYKYILDGKMLQEMQKNELQDGSFWKNDKFVSGLL